ncbi:GATA transcription factor 4-like [Salvia splendens]|uniref:GATA transcription factor 4-like n=1 Tax=Salvia splendens TaxID=180675 RepID=UPI001C25ED92|nr:GATA transcription factor 4-like [Salvia splendens]
MLLIVREKFKLGLIKFSDGIKRIEDLTLLLETEIFNCKLPASHFTPSTAHPPLISAGSRPTAGCGWRGGHKSPSTAAELEWLSTYMDDSFTDFPASEIATASVDFHGRGRSKRSRAANQAVAGESAEVARRCTHCASAKTPQ